MQCSRSLHYNLRTARRVACHVPHLLARGPPEHPDRLVSLVCHVFSLFVSILGASVTSWLAMSLAFRRKNQVWLPQCPPEMVCHVFPYAAMNERFPHVPVSLISDLPTPDGLPWRRRHRSSRAISVCDRGLSATRAGTPCLLGGGYSSAYLCQEWSKHHGRAMSTIFCRQTGRCRRTVSIGMA
jgi:hypothetical protein